MMSYKRGGKELTPDDMNTIKRFADAGGSLFLLCPVWVWTSYDHKPQEINPYYKIGKLFRLSLVDECPKGALRLTQNAIFPGPQIEAPEKWGTFSRVISANPTTISLIDDEANNSFGVAAISEKSKIVLIGHNFLARPDVYKEPGPLSSYTIRLLDWLLQD